jgi:hypothetical protein
MSEKSGVEGHVQAAVVDSDLAAGGSLGPSTSEKGKKPTAAASSGMARSPAGDQVEHLMVNLRLTAAESKAAVIDDSEDLELVDPKPGLCGQGPGSKCASYSDDLCSYEACMG